MYKWLHQLAGLKLAFSSTQEPINELPKFVSCQVDADMDTDEIVTTKQVFRQMWQRIVSHEALNLQIAALVGTRKLPDEIKDAIESKFCKQLESKISKFIKTNDKQWRCEIEKESLACLISASIVLDEAYPEVPPIFKLDLLSKSKAKPDQRDENVEMDYEDQQPFDLSCLLPAVEEELNIYHGDYCDPATHADLILSL